MTKRTITFDSAMNEITTITLDGELRVRDINATEIELREAAAAPEAANEVARVDLGVLTYSDSFYEWPEKSTGISIPKAPNTGVPPRNLGS